jgi:hypothetical protein
MPLMLLCPATKSPPSQLISPLCQAISLVALKHSLSSLPPRGRDEALAEEASESLWFGHLSSPSVLSSSLYLSLL